MIRQFKFIGELPALYEYKIIETDNVIKVIGVHKDKQPIGFILENGELKPIDIEDEHERHN